mgnify:CR=1 FL=1
MGQAGVTLRPVPFILPFRNNNDGSDPAIKGKRTPLTIAISKDEGKTWGNIKNIASDPEGWYCYNALYFIDSQNLILGHCAGNSVKGTGLAVTNLTTLNWVWVVRPEDKY